ncbi:MAG: hypothetical protein ACE5PV_12900 [Candidatus Poribacteria bacterium]
MSKIATLHNATLHFESEWLEKLNIGVDGQIEVNIWDGTLVIKPARQEEHKIPEDLINRIRERKKQMAMTSDSAIIIREWRERE